MSCPPFRLNSLLGKKWSLPLVELLATKGRMGFSEMERELGNITPKILSQRIQQMQSEGVMAKTDDFYHLTTQGERLYHVVRALKGWHDAESPGCVDKLCVCCPLFKP